jgi:hypothetical protein
MTSAPTLTCRSRILIALSLMAVWVLMGETHRGQPLTPALTLPQVQYRLSRLLLKV